MTKKINKAFKCTKSVPQLKGNYELGTKFVVQLKFFLNKTKGIYESASHIMLLKKVGHAKISKVQFFFY